MGVSTFEAWTWIAWAQGVFYFTTGIWPILHMPSFVAVTGPKADTWLVRTVGAVLAVIGFVCMHAAWSAQVSSSIALLGALSALALTIVDLRYVSVRRISKVYLLDALAETAIIAAWAWPVAAYYDA